MKSQNSSIWFSVAWILLPCLAASLAAQSPKKPVAKAVSSSASKLLSVKVTGSQRFIPEEISGATGLELGQDVGEDDFKRASERLLETGAFGDVAYSFQFSSDGTKLELRVTDAAQFVPARFDNFVWFSDGELLDKLHTRVPLFRNELPAGGTLVDQISDALQALLIENNIQGRADYLRYAHLDGPLEAFIFSVTAHNIRIRDVGFAGVAPSELPLLQAQAKAMSGHDYLRSLLAIQADKNFVPVYMERGYLKAVVSDAQPKVVETHPEETLVDVIFPVKPGLQYKVIDVQWSGDTVFPPEKLQPLIHLVAGEPANAVQLSADIEAIQKLYRTRGYMATSIRPVPQMDDSQSTVSYQLDVREGDVYKMGDLEIQGLDDHTTARLVDMWTIRPGEQYDASYPSRFLKEADSVVPLRQWNVNLNESPDAKTTTVDVTFRFDPKEPK